MIELRTGITTGTCAAAAAKAAAEVLCGSDAMDKVGLTLPGGESVEVEILYAKKSGDQATAAVCKDAGDDEDVTDGLEIQVALRPHGGNDMVFLAGEGVGTVTKPGLQVPPGEPAINPVPREMIRQAIASVTDKVFQVEVAIPGGRKIAAGTFNPRLGIEGGLSIIGTTGIVRPRCRKALLDALKCALDVAKACGAKTLVLVPGNIGSRAAHEYFILPSEQVIEVANEWAYVLERVAEGELDEILIVGHPGKLAKLAMGNWDTHSSLSPSAVPYVLDLACKTLQREIGETTTVEGILAALDEKEIQVLGNKLADRIARTVGEKVSRPAAVILVDMQGHRIGTSGDLSAW